MKTKRKVDIFSAECPLCQEAVESVRRIGCPSCEFQVPDPARDKPSHFGVIDLLAGRGRIARTA